MFTRRGFRKVCSRPKFLKARPLRKEVNLRDRFLTVVAVVILLAFAGLLFTAVLAFAIIFLVVGLVLAALFYVRLRFAMRRLRRDLGAAATQAGKSPQQPPGPVSGESIDADFRVDEE